MKTSRCDKHKAYIEARLKEGAKVGVIAAEIGVTTRHLQGYMARNKISAFKRRKKHLRSVVRSLSKHPISVGLIAKLLGVHTTTAKNHFPVKSYYTNATRVTSVKRLDEYIKVLTMIKEGTPLHVIAKQKNVTPSSITYIHQSYNLPALLAAKRVCDKYLNKQEDGKKQF